jgi:DNA-binding transcriptional LysR family regulator
LISLPPHELLPRLFQRELTKRGIIWRTELETSSQDLVTIYVRNGLGAGLAVMTPDLAKDPSLKVLPLTGFPALPIGAFWRGKPGEIMQVLLDGLKDHSQKHLIKNALHSV